MIRKAFQALVLGFAAAPAAGDAWDWNLNVNAELGYDDNWGMSSTDPVDGFRIRVTPDIFARWETDRALVEADAGVRFERYYGDAEEDRTNRQDPFAGIIGRYLLPYGEVGGAARYSKESLVDSEFQDTGVVTGRGSRTLVDLSGYWMHELTEIQSLKLSGGYQDATYTDDAYTDYVNWTAALTFSQALTHRTNAFVSVNTQLYRPEDEELYSKQNAAYATAGVNHEFSPEWSVNAWAGYGVIQRDLDDETTNGWLANLGFTRTHDFGRLNFGASREITPSGAGELAVRSRIYADATRQLAERWEAGLGAFWADNKYPFDDQVNPTSYGDYTQIEVAPRISYQLAPEWRVSAVYRYRQQERDTDDGLAESNAVFLTIGYVPERP